MSEMHEVVTDTKIVGGHEILLTRREPKNEAERNSYWYKAYKSIEETVSRYEGRITDLENILQSQIITNNVVGKQMRGQDSLMEDQFNDHNKEMHEMAEKIAMLSMQVIELGGKLED